jgi:hypothetical protein
MSQYLHSLSLGEEVLFKHISFNLKIPFPFTDFDTVSMVCGGSGVTPMYQALQVRERARGEGKEGERERDSEREGERGDCREKILGVREREVAALFIVCSPMHPIKHTGNTTNIIMFILPLSFLLPSFFLPSFLLPPSAAVSDRRVRRSGWVRCPGGGGTGTLGGGGGG